MSESTDKELTVEECLAELREMYPDCFRRVEMLAVQTPDGLLHEGSGWHVSVYREENRPLNWDAGECGKTLAEAMQKVRDWKSQQ